MQRFSLHPTKDRPGKVDFHVSIWYMAALKVEGVASCQPFAFSEIQSDQ